MTVETQAVAHDVAFGKAADIETLLTLWSRDRRAKGGWWALAGFSFQSAVYLLRFFEGLQEGVRAPPDLAKTELLSDILAPRDGIYTLIQVKRVLDRSRLIAAMREAYEIATLCKPDFLSKLRFKIACVACETPSRPKDVGLNEIAGESGNAETWSRLQECFADGGAVPSRHVLELAGASSGDIRLSDHAARSMI